MFYWSLFSWDPWLCLGENIESRYSNECSFSYYGLFFITWKYNAINKNWLWPQNWLSQTWNVFVFTFVKHLLKRRDVLLIKCFVEKVINHAVLIWIWTIRFNVKQVKQKPLKVCITWKVVGFLELLKKHQYASSNPVYHQHFYWHYTVLSFLERFFIENCLSLSYLIPKTTTPW